MFDFLFKKESKKDIQINKIYPKLKELFNFDEIEDERKAYLSDIILKYGYLNFPHQKALEEITPAEVLFGLEFKWKKEGVFDGEKFIATKTSALARHEIENSDWLKKEGHEIKLINLAALGNGNESEEPGKFIDWLKQLLILPTGNIEKGIFSTTIYLIPFHKREFGCAYLPSSNEVSHNIEDKSLKDSLSLEAKEQVQVFITLAQLAGHPVIYDILPQTGRFSKSVLANPEIARWYDIKHLMTKTDNCIELVAKELERKYDREDVEIVKNIYKQNGKGSLSEDYQKMYDELDKELTGLKKTNSNEMSKKDSQIKIQKRVRDIVAKFQDTKNKKQKVTEDNIEKQGEIIYALMQEGLWAAPGGAWCSAGVPVFDRMSDCGSYPVFKHFDYKNQDVTEFANLDCQTPYYFVYLENGHYNNQTTEFFINTMKKLQYEYNFDGFRVDHVDHVIDDVSVQEGKNISYRIPAKVLSGLNSSIKSKIPHFACIAEYMSTQFSKEYHQDMKFDILWGNDIPAQHEKTPERIIEDNQELSTYNTKDFKINDLSILKTYNNQDGEFEIIDQYPGQLGEDGALFKWLKYKLLPGGKYAQRPVLYVDGDESFTKIGIERTIGNEVSMVREKNYEFFAKFDAISRFAKSQELITEGEAQILTQEDDGFVCWLISKEPLKSVFLIAANYQAPTEKINIDDEVEIKEGEDILDKIVQVPGDYTITSEFIFNGTDYVEQEHSGSKNVIVFKKLAPSEFKMYLLSK